MKRDLLICFLLIASCVSAQPPAHAPAAAVRKLSFDDNWYFKKGDLAHAEQSGYDDAGWRKLDLPHDWSLEDLPNQVPDSIVGPFDKASPGALSTGFVIGGTGWYRKKFVTGKAFQKKDVIIYFDGVYMNSDVWINGHHLGDHPYGYSPFYYDLTPYLQPAGQTNVLAVRVRNEGKNSRWYSGSGIYRHVWLTTTDPVHVAPWGVYVTTPQVTNNKATVLVRTSVENRQAGPHQVELVTTIMSPERKAVGIARQTLSVDTGVSKTAEQSIEVVNPALWSDQKPRLYELVTEVREEGKTIDRVETPFGIRSIHVGAVTGLTVNGKRVLLKGGCIHHDNGPLGSAAIDRAEERKLEILKKNGFNAVRLSHNPPSQQLLDICDRLGMFVIDEAFDAWQNPKMPQDYHLYFNDWWQRDLEALLLRDRNHPSVIVWSIGNEIPERVDSLQIAGRLADRVHALDPGRPVTEAFCWMWEHPRYKWDTTAAAFKLLDIGGYNYLMSAYESEHQKYPQRVIMGTESFPKMAFENWDMVEKHPYVIGDFVWTAVDYLGEASIGNAVIDTTKKARRLLTYPWFNAWCGDIDLIGNKKPQSYYRDVVWRTRAIAMAVHEPMPAGAVENVSKWGWPREWQSWTWPEAEGKTLQVRVFSRAPMVRLLLNGRVVGEQKMTDSSITAVFDLPYEPGILKAVNVENGKETAAFELKTASAPKHIRLTPDRTHIRASRNDLSYVMVEITDDKGEVVPNANMPVRFSISGAGELAAVGNASPNEMFSYHGTERKTMNGQCLAIVRPVGKSGVITLTATAQGLTPAQATIQTQ